MTTTKTIALPIVPAGLIGDPHPLLEQIGATGDLAVSNTISASIEFRGVRDLASLRRFLDAYQERILSPLELPVIHTAYRHSARNEFRELLTLDSRLAGEVAIREFAAASCRVGQRQLSRLRPLRDEKLVQRYLAAIERGEAKGWHTLVYGLSLAVYSLPLRQGLQNYAEQTMAGFISSAAKSFQLPEADCESLLLDRVSCVPRAIETALSVSGSWGGNSQHAGAADALTLPDPGSA